MFLVFKKPSNCGMRILKITVLMPDHCSFSDGDGYCENLPRNRFRTQVWGGNSSGAGTQENSTGGGEGGWESYN